MFIELEYEKGMFGEVLVSQNKSRGKEPSLVSTIQSII